MDLSALLIEVTVFCQIRFTQFIHCFLANESLQAFALIFNRTFEAGPVAIKARNIDIACEFTTVGYKRLWRNIHDLLIDSFKRIVAAYLIKRNRMI